MWIAVSTSWGSFLWMPHNKSPTVWGLYKCPDCWKLSIGLMSADLDERCLGCGCLEELVRCEPDVPAESFQRALISGPPLRGLVFSY